MIESQFLGLGIIVNFTYEYEHRYELLIFTKAVLFKNDSQAKPHLELVILENCQLFACYRVSNRITFLDYNCKYNII